MEARVASQRTDLCSDVLKGGRTDQGEAYQEHILGENQRDGELRVTSAVEHLGGSIEVLLLLLLFLTRLTSLRMRTALHDPRLAF